MRVYLSGESHILGEAAKPPSPGSCTCQIQALLSLSSSSKVPRLVEGDSGPAQSLTLEHKPSPPSYRRVTGMLMFATFVLKQCAVCAVIPQRKNCTRYKRR